MDRKSFLGNMIGLIAVAANPKIIASIGVKNSNVSLPKNAIAGNVLIRNKDAKVFYFTGKYLISTTDNERCSDYIFSDSNSDFFILNSAFSER